jgi:spore maturation protein CgeB
MKVVIFGLSISSSWGNGHATLWRGLTRALRRRGHSIVFFERDVPYYAANRDLGDPDFCELVIYKDWREAAAAAVRHLNEADVGIVTSYCPDGIAATKLVLSSRVPVRVFYDLDSPVTLENLRAQRTVSYIGPDGLRGFDLVLSYTGGPALKEIQERLGARMVEPLYGSVDPEVHHPVEPVDQYRSDLCYLGTYAEDRQRVLERLFIGCARKLPHCRFVIGGSLYPQVFPWTDNIFFIPHVPPPEHSAFYCSSNLTLNVTRRAMAQMGYCPSGRLFEAAACGVPILSDEWEGLDHFFEPGEEIVVAGSTDEAIAALALPPEELRQIARRARERTLATHTAENRAEELERLLESAYARESVALHAGEA